MSNNKSRFLLDSAEGINLVDLPEEEIAWTDSELEKIGKAKQDLLARHGINAMRIAEERAAQAKSASKHKRAAAFRLIAEQLKE